MDKFNLAFAKLMLGSGLALVAFYVLGVIALILFVTIVLIT